MIDIGSYVRRMGPTWMAGAIAAGPATMASVVTAGATFGYDMLWIILLSAVLGAVAQYLAMRLGLLSGEGLVSLVETHLGDWWAWLLVVDTVLASGLAQLVIMKTVAGVSATVTGVGAFSVASVSVTASQFWALVWGVALAIGIAGGGYRFLELGAKVVVSAVVLAFVAALFVVPIDAGAAASGLVPTVPGGQDGALVAAGVLGGAVHITLVTMQSYTMRARGWTREEYDLGLFDVSSSMLLAFGGYSLAIFLVVASVLHGASGVDPANLGAVAAAQALEPLVGTDAKWLFLVGLWGAAVSTLGANTVVPPYLLADKLDWETDVVDSRFRAAVVAFALVGIGGVLLGGNAFGLLVQMLAFGLIGTPFAIALVLYLLNSTAVPESTPTLANLGGLVLIALSSIVAVSSLRDQVAGGVGPVSAFVLVFALVLAAAMLLLLAKVAGAAAGRSPTGSTE